MFFNFNQTPIDTYTISIYIGSQLVQQQQLQAPDQMAQMQFTSLAQQIAQEPQPMKLVFEKEEQVYDNYDNTTKTIPCKLEFMNSRYKDWEGTKC